MKCVVRNDAPDFRSICAAGNFLKLITACRDMRPTEQMSRNETITEERGLLDFSSQQFGQHCGSLRMPDQDESAPFGSIRDVMPERIENIRRDFKASGTGATNEVIFRNLDQAGNSWHWSLSIHRCVHHRFRYSEKPDSMRWPAHLLDRGSSHCWGPCRDLQWGRRKNNQPVHPNWLQRQLLRFFRRGK